MENTEKCYVSTQLVALLPPTVLKVLQWICSWQSTPKGVMLYEHRFARTLKLTDEEIRLSIQTLINLKLIDLTNIDGKFRIEFNKPMFDRYYKVPMEKVIEHNGFQMATEVTYDQDAEQKKQKDLSDMSDGELKTLLLRIQASLNERSQLREKVVSLQSNNKVDDLPW